MAYPGPYCQSLNITTEAIETRSLTNIEILSHGLALELKEYGDKIGLKPYQLLNIFSIIDDDFNKANAGSVHSKLVRLIEKKKKILSHENVRGVENLTQLLEQRFASPTPKPKCNSEDRPAVSVTACKTEKDTISNTAVPYSVDENVNWMTICGLCHYGREVEDLCGYLFATKECAAHLKCMQYSHLSQYNFPEFGGFKTSTVIAEIRRGRSLKCAICRYLKKKKHFPAIGATCGCAIKSCRKSFHFRCAKVDEGAITKRIEVTKASGGKMVLYRIFCSKAHQLQYESEMSTTTFIYNSESSNNSSDNDEPNSFTIPNKDVRRRKTRRLLTDSTEGFSQKSSHCQRSDNNQSSSSDDTVVHGTSNVEMLQISEHIIDEIASEDSPSKRQRVVGALMPTENTNLTLLQVKTEPFDEHCLVVRAVENENADVSAIVSENRNGEQDNRRLKLKVQADPEDCVICFLEYGHNQDKDTVPIMQNMAEQLYGLTRSSIYIWHYSIKISLSYQLMIYLFKDISTALSQADFQRMYHLLFDLSDQEITQYSRVVGLNRELGTRLEQEIRHKLQQQVHKDLDIAEAILKENVGCVLYDEKLQGNVMFLRISHVVDPGYMIRSRLGHHADLVHWSPSTVLQNFPKENLSQCQSHEKATFLKWLSKHVNMPQLFTWPQEPIFLANSPHACSVTYRLKQQYQKKKTLSQSNIVLVFLGPVDTKVINFGTYVRKMILQLIEERLDLHTQIFCIFDVGKTQQILEYSDIVTVDEVPRYAQVTVSSAHNPQSKTVTVVLVKIVFKSDEVSKYDGNQSYISSGSETCPEQQLNA